MAAGADWWPRAGPQPPRAVRTVMAGRAHDAVCPAKKRRRAQRQQRNKSWGRSGNGSGHKVTPFLPGEQPMLQQDHFEPWLCGAAGPEAAWFLPGW